MKLGKLLATAAVLTVGAGMAYAEGANIFVIGGKPDDPFWGIVKKGAEDAGIVVAAQGGPSSLYFSGSGCSCGWVPLTATGTSLPTAKIKVSLATGNTANGFVVFGENQFYTYTVKYTAGAGATPRHVRGHA